VTLKTGEMMLMITLVTGINYILDYFKLQISQYYVLLFYIYFCYNKCSFGEDKMTKNCLKIHY